MVRYMNSDETGRCKPRDRGPQNPGKLTHRFHIRYDTAPGGHDQNYDHIEKLEGIKGMYAFHWPVDLGQDSLQRGENLILQRERMCACECCFRGNCIDCKATGICGDWKGHKKSNGQFATVDEPRDLNATKGTDEEREKYLKKRIEDELCIQTDIVE